MRGSIEWQMKVNPELLSQIDNLLTTPLVRHSAKLAYPKAEVTFEKVKANCIAHGEEPLPFDNFLEIAFRDALKDSLGIRTGDMMSFAFNEWYSLHRSELLAHLS